MPQRPKRSDEVMGHKTRAERAEREARKAPGADEVPIPPAGDWCPQVQDFYRSLAESGQARFYEPSDWELAKFACELMDRAVTGDSVNSRVLAEVVKLLRDLMVSEGQRRAHHLELIRPEGVVADAPGVAVIAEYKARIGG